MDSSLASKKPSIHVDVIIPVHNASETIEEAVNSAMGQKVPVSLIDYFEKYEFTIFVCCYDDGSSDDSYMKLRQLKEKFSSQPETENISSTLLIKASVDGVARGAGYARNKAIQLNDTKSTNHSKETHHFLCLLDSDDTMHCHRVAEQASYMLNRLDEDMRDRTLLGCNFIRDPPDSQWHYSEWANSLSDERLVLEQFREVTILQPTWFLCKKRWFDLGGYIEAPTDGTAADLVVKEKRNRLIHTQYDNQESLRLAEDLRFFHEHIWSNGVLRIHRTKDPLVMYRHKSGSQSFRTSRKLLLQLRVLAFEHSILTSDPGWQEEGGYFAVWGAGRDGKDFAKALRPDMRKRIMCFVDIDAKKIDSGSYVNRQLDLNIPIIHFSYLAKDSRLRHKMQKEWEENTSNNHILGRIDKTREQSQIPTNTRLSMDSSQQSKRRRLGQIPTLKLSGLSQAKLERIPVVVCVAMYRTNGELERNVKAIGRVEGKDLWHFS